MSLSWCWQVFHVPLEERRYKKLDQAFSSDRTAQDQACQQISKQHDVHIETTLARDQSLTVVLTGKADAVMKAKRDVINRLQTQVSCQSSLDTFYLRSNPTASVCNCIMLLECRHRSPSASPKSTTSTSWEPKVRN